MTNTRLLTSLLLSIVLATTPFALSQQQPATTASRQKVIVDTDIGDDIDDAFGLALVLSSPEIELLGVSSAWGNTQLRARIVERMLCETGNNAIPVFAGIPSTSKINMDEDHEVKYWTQHFGISREELQKVIDRVGNSARDVAREFSKGL